MFQHCFVALSFWLIAANQAAPLQSRPKLKGVIIRVSKNVYNLELTFFTTFFD